MSFAAAALHHSRAIVLVAIALVIAGVLAGLSLPSSIYPPLEFPRIVTIVKSGTLPSQSMMLTVTRPVEQAVMGVPGIRRVRSKSIRGASEISAQFAPATDMVIALQQVQNRVSEIRGELPPDAEIVVERTRRIPGTSITACSIGRVTRSIIVWAGSVPLWPMMTTRGNSRRG